MKLLQVFLTNFKSFIGEHQFVLDREPGLYYITGENKVEPDLGANGIGKSTLIDAIVWCLFGVTVRKSNPGAAVEAWDKRTKPTSVALLIETGSKRFTVERSRTRGANNALLIDGTEVEQHAVDKAIGLNADAFLRTLIRGQFGDSFLDMTAGEQSELFTQALNLDIWLALSDQAAKKALAYDRDLASAQSTIDRLDGELTAMRTMLERATDAEKSFEIDTEHAIDQMLEVKEKTEAALKALGSQAPAMRDLTAEIKAERFARERLDQATRATRTASDELGRAQMRLKDAEQRERTYSAALKFKKCPECGQTVEEAHIKAKLDEMLVVLEAGRVSVDTLDRRHREATADEVRKASSHQIVAADLHALQEGQYQASLQREEWTRDHAKQTRDLENANKQLDWLDKVKNPHTAEIAKINDDLADRLSRLGSAKDLLNKLQAAAARLRQWVEGFKEIRLQLIDETLAELEMATNSHAEALGLIGWTIKFATERETKAGKVSKGMSTMLYPPGRGEPVPWESYSGGESQRWMLAVTFGLSEVLLARAGILPNIEILDEPTQHLSQAGIDDLLDHLKQRAIDTQRAIYFIDHRALDRGAFDGVIQIEKDQAGSRLV